MRDKLTYYIIVSDAYRITIEPPTDADDHEYGPPVGLSVRRLNREGTSYWEPLVWDPTTVNLSYFFGLAYYSPAETERSESGLCARHTTWLDPTSDPCRARWFRHAAQLAAAASAAP